ncbi:MAG: heme ABC exporter ATP-binding protein CcmA [Clostridium sp.]
MLEAIEIYKHFKKKEILKGVSFKAGPGTCVGIAGGNGCGKTTLLSILAGVTKPDTGKILLDGQDIIGRRTVFEREVAYVPQENPIIPELTARDNFTLWYKGNRTSMAEDLRSGVAQTLGLPEFLNTPAGKLSGGQKKRLSIASALSNHASLLILDEPGAALDLEAKEMIIIYLKNYLKQGGTVILTSHEMGELDLCDELFILKDGVPVSIPVGLPAEELIQRF